jgi:hypothetical protein
MSRTVPALGRALLFALAASLLAVTAGGARADEEVILPPKKLIRPFPQGKFCPLQPEVAFTATGSVARIVFEAKRFCDDNGTIRWTQQYIDNVSLATKAVYDAHFALPPASGASGTSDCYNNGADPVSYFYADDDGVVTQLLERFDTDAGAWDVSHGAYYESAESAPRNMTLDEDETGGSLGLGNGDPPVSLDEVATTSITVTGLKANVEYKMSAWWDVHGSVVFPHTYDYLTITVFGESPVPIARTTWGTVKGKWRETTAGR